MNDSKDPIDIIDMRLALGEITPEQHMEMSNALNRVKRKDGTAPSSKVELVDSPKATSTKKPSRATWVSAAVIVTVGIAALIFNRESPEEKCTRLASHPLEQIGSGVTWNALDRPKAVAACRAAVKSNDGAEFKYRLGRALVKGEPTETEFQQGLQYLEQALEQGHIYAASSLAGVYSGDSILPKDSTRALYYAKLLYDAGIPRADEVYGAALLNGTLKVQRSKGAALLEAASSRNPTLHMPLAHYYLNSARPKNYKKSLEHYQLAAGKGYQGAYSGITQVFNSRQSPMYSKSAAYVAARMAIKDGDLSAYSLITNAHYQGQGRKLDLNKALYWAKEGSKANDPSSAYKAAVMYSKGKGTQKNSLTANEYAQRALALGNKDAQALLDKIESRVSQLKAMPNYTAQSCVRSTVSRYDKNIVDFFNKCDSWLNVLVCSTTTAGDFMSIFDNKDRETCSRKQIKPNSYIENLYGADENSAFLRKVISTSSVKVLACHTPLTVTLGDGKWYCRET